MEVCGYDKQVQCYFLHHNCKSQALVCSHSDEYINVPWFDLWGFQVYNKQRDIRWNPYDTVSDTS